MNSCEIYQNGSICTISSHISIGINILYNMRQTYTFILKLAFNFYIYHIFSINIPTIFSDCVYLNQNVFWLQLINHHNICLFYMYVLGSLCICLFYMYVLGSLCICDYIICNNKTCNTELRYCNDTVYTINIRYAMSLLY